MRRLALLLVGLLTVAGAPPQTGFSIATPGPVFTVTPQQLGKSQTNSGYAPAPLPNRDASTPVVIPQKGSRSAELAPGFFSRSDQYHGQALSASSSVQSDQERRAKPGAGFNLIMPLQ